MPDEGIVAILSMTPSELKSACVLELLRDHRRYDALRLAIEEGVIEPDMVLPHSSGAAYHCSMRQQRSAPPASCAFWFRSAVFR